MNEDAVSDCFFHLMDIGLGLDMSDPNLKDTPDRVARMFCREFFKNVGVEYTDWKAFPNSKNYSEIVLFDLITFTSYCSHHFLPFTGLAWFMYIPKPLVIPSAAHKLGGLLVGASKPARAVEHYAQRPQLQEDLGHDVITSFNKAVNPLGSMLVMRAKHGCIQCRGVKQTRSGLTTSIVTGCFLEDPTIKNEGLDLIKISLLMD